MLQVVKDILRRTHLFALYKAYQQRRLYREWIRLGKPLPPPHLVKQKIIIEYARKFNLSVFIETGTFTGDMVYAIKDVFNEIYSVELGLDLYLKAKRRFADKKHITILQGDSGKVLKTILAQVQKPCLFWLDGHYSEGITAKSDLETPIQNELLHIFNHPMALDHVILIDDARCFTGEGDYPYIQTLKDSANSVGFDGFEVKDDIIRINKDKTFLEASAAVFNTK